ncbi:hypothetical protein E5K00_02040 [Hymenobacter aquaticus]|uniref:Uncharacterized protein n=1 Tax=Hymenobacter aquaticus TaxID=1867101 RepID=A0A4Z0Q1S5_9BACT|nr:hypothetical protein [Hymenobacter aquaticus]TGE24018.1 hypothetical protein E5K00_02040 [Hymenobacter aquaticus]
MKYSLPEQVIRKAFFLSVWCLEQCSAMTPYHQKIAALNKLPEGTVGKELATCLLARNLTLVPGFESHDLKHVVLDYEMEPLGEIRLQAFMLGNGNWTLPSLLIFLFGLLLLPQHWRLFRQDFKAGQRCPALATLEIEDCQEQPLPELRKLIFSRYHEIKPTMKPTPHLRLSTLASYCLLVVGTAAMLFCYPFLWSSNLADLVGAGFPFVAGAIFVVGGLLNLTLQSATRAGQAKP